ncbi:hypothetical protein SAPIO_CDS7692 [Scedosporium apiospermum]|uniref:Protein kinase domain-containing protein n=1 Tax=Pseudallescheria apiosperma TaxID=563466 RepID=A0A084G2H0_PSEDA|nr:uncharacterized protein SAPIO_CDS7692 [Scedosporium apiospermum]KEZ41532.1 hypothetical protein SAPIO_CDS7692 [Scedosporium apiospermum]
MTSTQSYSPEETRDVDKLTSSLAGLPSPTIAVQSHDDATHDTRSIDVHIASQPKSRVRYKSPIRQHRRTPSQHREIKETLDARTQYASDETDGRVHHRINQYVIQREIGRGSYGAVHLATDHNGRDFAVKEFSKARLRRRERSNILRQGPRTPMRINDRRSLNAPLSPHFSDFVAAAHESRNDALYLIRKEIAIMKKLNHPNLVQLIEVLDDPEEDSLYMVLEMCKKGVVMKVGLGEKTTPYPENTCRTWFRDLILGIEYLHRQGVIHRDIKPDNLLLSDDDDALKIVDFGVSEMFEKSDEMRTAKHAGSPAFLPPELCVARHGDVSGRAADIWSMGVTLYCLRYGKLPFEKINVLDMYESIRNDEPEFPPDEDPDFLDLMHRLLEKDPEKRIQIPELRVHPWVTNYGNAMLLSVEENCADPVEPPNEIELNRALTRKMNHLLCVMKVRYKLKLLVARRRAANKTSASPSSSPPPPPSNTDIPNAEEIQALIAQRNSFRKERTLPLTVSTSPDAEPLYLGVGLGVNVGESSDSSSTAPFGTDDGSYSSSSYAVVSDSPVNVDFNIYDRAYEEELQRILTNPLRRSSSVYMNNHVREKEQIRGVDKVLEGETPEGQGPRGRYPRRGRRSGDPATEGTR